MHARPGRSRPARCPGARRVAAGGDGATGGRRRPDDRDGALALQGGRRILRQKRVRAGAGVVSPGLRVEASPRGAPEPRMELLEERAHRGGRALFQAVPERRQRDHRQAARRRQRRADAGAHEARPDRGRGGRRNRGDDRRRPRRDDTTARRDRGRARGAHGQVQSGRRNNGHAKRVGPRRREGGGTAHEDGRRIRLAHAGPGTTAGAYDDRACSQAARARTAEGARAQAGAAAARRAPQGWAPRRRRATSCRRRSSGPSAWARSWPQASCSGKRARRRTRPTR